MSHDQRDQCHIPQKYNVIFVDFRLMKNIIFNNNNIIIFIANKTLAGKATQYNTTLQNIYT